MRMEQKNKIFRQRSLDRIASPEKLNDYMRVTTPSVWLVLSAVVVLLLGFLYWAAFGRLDVVVAGGADLKDGTAQIYILGEDANDVKVGMPVEIGGKQTTLLSVPKLPILADETMDARLLELTEAKPGDVVYVLTAAVELPDGIYAAEVITEQIRPFSFLDV